MLMTLQRTIKQIRISFNFRKACLLSAAVNLVPIVAVEDSEGEQEDL